MCIHIGCVHRSAGSLRPEADLRSPELELQAVVGGWTRLLQPNSGPLQDLTVLISGAISPTLGRVLLT